MRKALKRTALCLLAALLSLTSLSSCSGGQAKKRKPFEEVYESSLSFPLKGAYTSSTEIDFSGEVTHAPQNKSAVFVYLCNKHYCFYNVDLGGLVLTIDENLIASESDISLYDGYISVTETNPYSKEKGTAIYTDKGKLIHSVAGKRTLTATKSGFHFAGKLYRVEDGVVEKEYPLPASIDPYADYLFLDDWIVLINDRTASYYNEQFEIIAQYEVPGHSQTYKLYLLDNGKIFAQYTTLCDSVLEKYDYTSDSDKYKLHHELFDPTKEKTKKLRLDGIYVTNVYNRAHDKNLALDFEDIYTDEVENVICYHKIVDRVRDTSVNYSALLGNDGKLGASLQYLDDQKGPILPLNNGQYYATTKNGCAILDTRGNIVGVLPSSQGVLEMWPGAEFGYMTWSKIYNHDFELAVDLNSAGYNRLNTQQSSVAVFYYKRNGNDNIRAYRYDKNGEARITAPEGQVLVEGFGSVSVSSLVDLYSVQHYKANSVFHDRLYSHYGFNGDYLFTSKTGFEVIAEGEDAMVVKYAALYPSYTNSIYTAYARITKG